MLGQTPGNDRHSKRRRLFFRPTRTEDCMSRTLDAVLAIVLTFAAAIPGAAQPSGRSGSAGCDDGWNDSRRASFCEVREETIPGVNPLDVDAGQNGGIRVRG